MAQDLFSGRTVNLNRFQAAVRVLQVLKNAMLDGVYVDVEAADHSGKYDHLWKSEAGISAMKN